MQTNYDKLLQQNRDWIIKDILNGSALDVVAKKLSGVVGVEVQGRQVEKFLKERSVRRDLEKRGWKG